MSSTRKDFKNVFINVIGGLIAAGLVAIFNYMHENPDFKFSWIFNDPFNFFSDIYFRYSIPMRLNMFIWGMTFFIYLILDKYDKQLNIDSVRKIKEENMKNGIFLLYSFFAAIGLIFIDQNIIDSETFSIASNAIGIILTAVGFVVLIFGRVEIDGLWGPHVYEYSDQNFQRIVKTGFYKHMRHPIYFGQATLALSTFVLSQTLWFVIFPLLVMVVNAFRAYIEEKNLLELYPIEYEEYRKEVNKWWFY